MRLKPQHTGWRVRKKSWPIGSWIDLKYIGKFQVFAKDESEKDVILQRDYWDDSWVRVRTEDQDEDLLN